jgi:hypothetical protein
MGSTPIYGIRYPDPTTKAYQLPASFQTIAGDIEAALVAAEIPPVVPAPVMVAATAAARDAYWGVPATGAEQITLQNRGAQTVRTDTGWTERYFGVFNATTNPGGAQAAGWYPIAGELPRVRARRLATQALTSSWALLNACWGAPTDLRGFTYAAGAFTCAVAGLYEVQAFLQGANANTALGLQVTLNSTAQDTAATIAVYNSTGAVPGPTGNAQNSLQPLAVGDVLRVYGLGGSSQPVGTFVESCKLNVINRGPW